jgi:hypothetical protein
MVERVSLLDELRSMRVTGAVLTTYSIDFPFFESVVLRRLLASGCEHQILLVDATQCALAFANPYRRPYLAGTAYTLVPVHFPGAFHPKLLVLLGKKGGKLFVGSHNVTFSGYGGNAEVTNLIHASVAGTREAAPLFRSALGAVRSWATSKTTLAHDALDAMERAAPWLAAPAARPPQEALLWSGAETPQLWEQLRGRLTGSVRRVTAVGPFFDEGLKFLLRVQADLKPQELIVGIDTSAVVGLPEPVAWLAARFVDVRPMLNSAGVGQSSDLHAKILRIESDTEDLLITGSANPSAAAWLAKGRNAEAVIVRRSPSSEVLDSMGFSAFYDAPEVSAAQWTEILDRHRARLATETPSRVVASIRIGLLEDGRIAVHDPGVRPTSVGLHLREETVVDAASWALDGDTLLISASPETLAVCHLVELRGAPPVFAVVHHVAQLRPRPAGNVQGPLRAALAGILDDPERLEDVLRIVDKAIFDDEEIDVAVRSRAMRAAQPRLAVDPGEDALGSRAIPLEDVKRRGAARRKLADGNLAIVIDMLFQRLGAGLEYEAPVAKTPEVEEKDLEPLERSAPHDPPPINGAALTLACQQKVKALLRRMVTRLGQVQKSGVGALPAIVQLAAILGVLRWMHRVEKQLPWLPMGDSPMRKGGWLDFFSRVVPYVAPGRASVLGRARVEAGDEPWEEASVVLGLLAWTGLLAKIDLSALKPHPHDDERLAYHRAGLLLEILRQIAEDEHARRILGDAMPRLGREGRVAEAWLATHLAWGDAFALAASDPSAAPTCTRATRRGDVVRLDMPGGNTGLAFVVELDGTKIRVTDPGEGAGRAVLSRYATVIDLAKLFA